MYVGVSIATGYILALFFVGFPCSVYEDLSKKKLSEGIEDKITHKASAIFSTIIILQLLYKFGS